MNKQKQLLLILILSFGINNSISAQWATVFSDSSKTITDIFCLNKDTCWVSGTNGLLAKTTNGGLSWRFIQMDSTKSYGEIYFINEFVGFLSESPNSLLEL